MLTRGSADSLSRIRVSLSHSSPWLTAAALASSPASVAVRSCAICCNGVECLLVVVGNAEKMVMRWLLARYRGEKMVLQELAVVAGEVSCGRDGGVSWDAVVL